MWKAVVGFVGKGVVHVLKWVAGGAGVYIAMHHLNRALDESKQRGRADAGHDEFLERCFRNLDVLCPSKSFAQLKMVAQEEESGKELLLSSSLLPESGHVRGGARGAEDWVLRNTLGRSKSVGFCLADSLAQCSDCSICLDSFESNAQVECRVLTCGHIFHTECVDKWVAVGAMRHVDPARYIRNERGAIEPTAPMPHCPLCKHRLGVIDARDTRDALLRAFARYERNNRRLSGGAAAAAPRATRAHQRALMEAAADADAASGTPSVGDGAMQAQQFSDLFERAISHTIAGAR
ncbi:hypothetical protein FVE85_1534 [Porphyridium purpureum]|uniref:RING-type E3 ubiquitin transferase n=1 Tax=Porphyridium purpureum TaxID=35688 RepID=A0A5J4YV52_PORPP|nr:hypothetical protein FVE85_1534 [Porphyridium purpureum]|eukprot:POR5539..scf209_3